MPLTSAYALRGGITCFRRRYMSVRPGLGGQRLHTSLYRDLGMVPSKEVQELQRAILDDGLAKSLG